DGIDRQLLDPEVDRVSQPSLDRVRPRLVSRHHRQAFASRPATVAVGDDRYVAHPGALLLLGGHYTSRISASLCFSSSSSSFTRASVTFWSSCSARCSSSEPASPASFSSRRSCITSRRMLRIATLPSSAIC